MELVDRGLVFDASTASPNRKGSAFTSLARLFDGSILCTFKSGPQKLSPTDTIVAMQSTDEGRTWTQLFEGFPPVFEGVPGSFTSGYPFEIAPGRLRMALVWVDRSHPDRPLANPDTTGLLPMKCLLSESEDAGATWGPLREVILSPHTGNALTGEILRLDDGTLALPYESWKEWDDIAGVQSGNLRFSRDNGRTWNEWETIASHPNQDLYYWDNRVAKHPESGRLVALFWTHDPHAGLDRDIHIAWSDPDGRNWSLPAPTGIAGQIAAPLPMGGDDLLCLYVHRHDPPSIRAVLSHNLGRTWDINGELTVYQSGAGVEAGTTGPRHDADYWNDMYRWTFGHAKGLVLKDGSVLCAFYGGAPDALSIHWARLRV
ncbi:MAG TPA: sialidase family protein [Candidatus Hydrogenedentes bacterium]|nr:sialidase family protein [Candidatus Hydrogenedentota bacterium]HPG65270.1 sialidase family protein [Candidatus Hydrogenedentota bacterium]